MGRKTRVCCFCETWESGGIESFLFNVITHMNQQDLEIDIVAAELRDSIFTTPLEAAGIKFYRLSGKQNRILANWKQLKKLFVARQYDVVHLNIFHAFSLRYAALAKTVGVSKIIVHSHNTALRKSVGRPLKLLIHNISKFLWAECATDFWACSGDAARFLFPAKIAENSYKFIPNGIETERFRFSPVGRTEVRRELGIADDTLLVGNVGRLCYQKNQRFLLDVFAYVQKKNQKSRLLLVGEGELRAELEKKAEALGVAEGVIFYGVSKHIERLLWAMDVFVLPSLFEGLGIVAIEAQAAGLPVLCSEYVPEEINFAGKVHYLPISLGAAKWAETISSFTAYSKRRIEFADIDTLMMKFDITVSSDLISNAYKGLNI